MADASMNQGVDEILQRTGPDATATFENSTSNLIEHVDREAMNAATAGDGEDEGLEEEDDDAAALEEDDEENEEVDVEDEADAQD
jgi:hypothetical protein